ncbi:hypothetical protein PGQ11_014677 [Apiospora arundinis]|uniref:Uncharacterized protein n=1 Tax=Apiospora arundinis TaxID=335852 RepID=A0ABR2HSY9_9PEZI
MQPAMPFVEPSPPPHPSIHLQAVAEEEYYATSSPARSVLSGGSTGLSIAGPRPVISRQASPLARSTDNYPITTSPQRSVASDAGASDTTVDFASQRHRIDEALLDYRGAASASASTLDPSLPPFYPKKKPGTSNSWTGSLPDDKIKGMEMAPVPSSLSDIGSRVHSRPITPGTSRKARDYKGKGKEIVQPASSFSDMGSRASSRPTTPSTARYDPQPGWPEQQGTQDRVSLPSTPIQPAVDNAQSNALLSPALSATPAPQVEAGAPSVRSCSPARTETGSLPGRSPSPAQTEKPPSQPSTPVTSTTRALQVTPGSEQSINPSWATVAGPTRRKALLPPLSTLQPHEAVTPTPPPKKTEFKKAPTGGNSKAAGQSSVTIGRSWTTSTEPTKPNTPPPDTTEKAPELDDTPDSFPSLPGPSSGPKPVTSKPKRSYSAALATAGEPAKTKATPTPRSASDDWPAPPPSWGRGRGGGRGRGASGGV